MVVARDFNTWLALLFKALVEDGAKAPGELFALDEIADSLGQEYPAGWVDKAAQILEQNGWAQIDRTSAGSIDKGIRVQLTGAGFQHAQQLPVHSIDRSTVSRVAGGKAPPESAAPTPPPITIAPQIGAVGAGAYVIIGQTNAVTIDTAGPDWQAFEMRVADVLEQIRRSNELTPQEKQQLASELSAGVQVMKAPAIERSLVERLVWQPLKYLAEKFASSAVGAAATEAVKWLTRLLG